MVTGSNGVQDPHGRDAIVHDILPRSNALERLPPDRPEPELLAANLTCLCVVIARIPETDWHLVDRYLAAAELMDCRAMLVDNKSDVDAPETTDVSGGRDRDLRCDSDIAVCPCPRRRTTARIRSIDALRGEIAILVGQSGVGKSSLINRLVPGADIVVGDLSAATDEGTHTTTASAMHRLPGGGRLIDTPGVRDFVPAIVDRSRLQVGFREIRKFADGCRFADCRHLREPDCAVKRAVDEGRISARRYETYKRLARDA